MEGLHQVRRENGVAAPTLLTRRSVNIRIRPSLRGRRRERAREAWGAAPPRAPARGRKWLFPSSRRVSARRAFWRNAVEAPPVRPDRPRRCSSPQRAVVFSSRKLRTRCRKPSAPPEPCPVLPSRPASRGPNAPLPALWRGCRVHLPGRTNCMKTVRTPAALLATGPDGRGPPNCPESGHGGASPSCARGSTRRAQGRSRSVCGRGSGRLRESSRRVETMEARRR